MILSNQPLGCTEGDSTAMVNRAGHRRVAFILSILHIEVSTVGLPRSHFIVVVPHLPPINSIQFNTRDSSTILNYELKFYNNLYKYNADLFLDKYF